MNITPVKENEISTEDKHKDTLKEYNFFGTDMATWTTNQEGITVIESGSLYGIEDHQYCPEEGDITRSKAIAILSWL